MSSKVHPRFPLPLLRFWTLRILPIWSLIALVIFLFQIAICGIVHDNETVKTFVQFLDMLPSFIKTALGGEALKVGNVSGLIAIGYNHPLVLTLYMLFAVGVPTGLLAGEVQKGTMRRFVPMPENSRVTYVRAPSPRATSNTTDVTPMMTPSMVRALRILLAARDPNATEKLSAKFIGQSRRNAQASVVRTSSFKQCSTDQTFHKG